LALALSPLSFPLKQNFLFLGACKRGFAHCFRHYIAAAAAFVFYSSLPAPPENESICRAEFRKERKNLFSDIFQTTVFAVSEQNNPLIGDVLKAKSKIQFSQKCYKVLARADVVCYDRFRIKLIFLDLK